MAFHILHVHVIDQMVLVLEYNALEFYLKYRLRVFQRKMLSKINKTYIIKAIKNILSNF